MASRTLCFNHLGALILRVSDMPFLASIWPDSANFIDFKEIVGSPPINSIIGLMNASNIKYYTASSTATFCETVWCQKRFSDIAETWFFSALKLYFRRCTCFIDFAHEMAAPSGRTQKGRSDDVSYELASDLGRLLHKLQCVKKGIYMLFLVRSYRSFTMLAISGLSCTQLCRCNLTASW